MSIDRRKYLDAAEVKLLRTVSEAWAITDLAQGRKQGVITWMVVDTAMSTGLRVSEIMALRVEDINFTSGYMTVSRNKRKKPVRETLAISKGFSVHLRDYLDWSGTKEGPMFIGSRGRLTVQGLQRIWKAAIKRAGMRRELSIHCARHTMAVHLLRKTKNLRQVQLQLGHSSPTTTAVYAGVAFEDMKDGVTNLYESETPSSESSP